MINKLTIVISGQICRENSSNLKSFWEGFINIQKSIYDIKNLKIVGHSWNPEFDDLVKNVYNIDILESEKQPSFSKEYMSNVNAIDKFENGIKRYNSKWKRVNYQALIGNAKSRSKAISIIDNLEIEDGDVILATRWDQGCSGSIEVNKIIFDQSLNENYLYMSYYNSIDQGYADMWFLAPSYIARRFKNYDDYVLDSISGKNNFFETFTNSGWPLALDIKKEKYKGTRFSLKVLNVIDKYLFIKYIPLLNKRVKKTIKKLNDKLEKPFISGENSLLFSSKTKITYPNYQALNNHAILKSFVINNDLRDKTRFLDINDFESEKEGQIINQIDFAYVIYSHSSFSDCWKMAVNQALECLPENCEKIFLISDNTDDSRKEFKKIFVDNSNVELLTYSNDDKYTNRLIGAFKTIYKNFKFIYFTHEDMPLTSSVDKVYLNTLLHFLNNSNEFYIKLVDTSLVNLKEEHASFPLLCKNNGGYSISVQPSLFKADFLISFLKNFNDDIYGFEHTCTNSNFTFSAVKGDRKVGKYLIANKYFPHIATAITKGKWCTSEWKDEIDFLSKKYDIDLTLRGEV